MRALAKQQRTQASPQVGLAQDNASQAFGVHWMPSAPACLLGGVVVSSIGLGFVLGSLRADAADTSFRIVEASFHANGQPGALARDIDLPATAAALPETSIIEGDLAQLQTHLKRQRASADLNPDVLVSAIGRVKGEILELRVLFKRLADVAELYDGEFDLDFDSVIDPVVDLPAAERQEELDPDLPGTGDDLSHLQRLSVHHSVDELTLSIAQLDHISEQTERMQSIFLDRSSAHDRRITEWPLQGGRMSSGFGHRMHPITGLRQLHRGMDFAARIGTPILAMADGIVAFSGPNGSYGNLVELEHGDGYRTRYAHNDRNLVEAGQRVLKGQQIALLGSTGRSTGPHVHVEVRREGTPLDPAIFLR